ncbi:hypothetical protein HPB51_010808 [Rhipicephalus microplus]|uniref:Uncharacterized protein n=1 Tax=Rhipicephalus microplus TaxID=6941 RepID=A0A9J6DMF3_RHIMP|nr:hypothetical protein HPB51_010808 [Rhipicephalus microplus]
MFTFLSKLEFSWLHIMKKNAGRSGLGKSTLINTLFKANISRRSCTKKGSEGTEPAPYIIPKTTEVKSVSHDSGIDCLTEAGYDHHASCFEILADAIKYVDPVVALLPGEHKNFRITKYWGEFGQTPRLQEYVISLLRVSWSPSG